MKSEYKNPRRMPWIFLFSGIRRKLEVSFGVWYFLYVWWKYSNSSKPGKCTYKGKYCGGIFKNPELTEGIADYQAPDVEIAAEFNSVEEMRQGKEGLEAGQYIKTKNYYADCNGGGTLLLLGK